MGEALLKADKSPIHRNLTEKKLRFSAENVGRAFLREQDRWILWLPVGLACGIGGYFSLSTEPPLWTGPALLAVTVFLFLVNIGRILERPALFALVLGIGAVSTGFSVAQWRTAWIAAPVLSKSTGPVSVSGRLVRIEDLPKGQRITLEKLQISRLTQADTPDKVRIRLAQSQAGGLTPGDWVTVRASLSPPPAPSAPGVFDFQRQAFFQQLGGVGFAFGRPQVITPARQDGLQASAFWVAKVRLQVSTRVRDHLDGVRGAIAAALMTGEKKSIPDKTMTAIRDSGLAHLLAISGLHIGLVAGILFFGLRALLSLAPPLALRYPIKKWAAVAAIAGAFAYAQIAGATVPTQRAFLMVSIVLLAVLIDRRGLSVRLVAWAAVIILLLHPESLLGASFQLSFAAVTALIAAYEWVRERRLHSDRAPRTWRRRLLLYIGGVALTTVIAGLATAPYAVFHFNRFAVYGLAANLVAVPVTALWVMPWAVGAFILMPFGAEHLALAPMAWGIDIIVTVAETVSSWPGAVSLMPSMPTWGVVVLTAGGLWLCLWRYRWRLLGVAGILAGLLTLYLADIPDILIDGKGRLMAVRSGDGLFAVSSRRAASFSRKSWYRLAGQEDDRRQVWPAQGSAPGLNMACDSFGCIYRHKGQTVAFVRREGALIEDCWAADIVISLVPLRHGCPSAHTVIDRFDLWRNGAHAVWLAEKTGNGVKRARVERVNESRGWRPWVVRPEPRKSKKGS